MAQENYTKEAGNIICEAIAHDSNLELLTTNAFLNEKPDIFDIMRWLDEGAKEDAPKELQDFVVQFEKAMLQKADLMFHEIIATIEGVSVDQAKIENMKWIISEIKEKYGNSDKSSHILMLEKQIQELREQKYTDYTT